MGDYVDFDGSGIGDAIEQAVVDKVREHGENFHNCFCWNCGYNAKIAKVAPCPRCGAIMNGPMRFLTPCAPVDPGRPRATHWSIRRYQKRSIITMLVFGIIVSIIIAAVMFFSGDLDFDDEGIHIMSMILTVLWLFWFVWLLFDFANVRKKINSAGAYNQNSGEMDIYCAMCETPTDRIANYCGLCGCIIPK